ncbi:bile acid:sodium symporter [Rathayibacter sp. PhB179]|uniref:bile acid:sodium symporter n=1 Tax=unclassified Rathayibacter TaxID=2609250 RepID=UPI003261834F
MTADVLEREAEFLAGLDEVQACEHVRVVVAIPVAAAAGGDESDGLVVPQRRRGDAAALADVRDPHTPTLRPEPPLDLQAARTFTVALRAPPTSRSAAVSAFVEWLEHRQIALYLVAIAAGAALGLLLPAAHRLEVAIEPVLALLLFATFLGVPFAAIGRSLRDGRFLAAVGVLNFVVVPVVAYGLSRFVADSQALLFGVLLVLLTPCIDYVIVFAGLAGGASDRLLAAAPLLMLAQILLLPLYLLLFLGPEGIAVVEVGPFARAFLLLIVVPLTAAALVQALGRRHRAGRVIESTMLGLMVPLMMGTLFVVVASQAGAVGAAAGQLLVLVPIYAGFLLVMAAAGLGVARLFRLEYSATRALVFSGATRNSLVVLPLALALPASLALAPVVVVTQTLVELVGMVVFVRLIPRLAPERAAARPSNEADRAVS